MKPCNDNTAASRLTLASASPRRLQLLREHGYAFVAIEPPLPEPKHLDAALCPEARAEAISYFKASSVAQDSDTGFILAGDTITALGDQVFGKPTDREDARRILLALLGTTHQVITGIALINAATGQRRLQHAVTAVTMRSMTDLELQHYLDSQAWVGKAGAYGIQDHHDLFVESIDGSYSNVVGFPMELVAPMLADWGVFPQENKDS